MPISYVGVEPNADFAEAARRVPTPFPKRFIVDDALKLIDAADPWGVDHVDLFLALGTLCYVPPIPTKRIFGRLDGVCDHIIVRDYLGNAAGTEPNSAILYSPSFAMYAHPYGEYLDAAGFTIEDIRPSIAGHSDGRSWGVLTASRTSR